MPRCGCTRSCLCVLTATLACCKFACQQCPYLLPGLAVASTALPAGLVTPAHTALQAFFGEWQCAE